MYINDIYLSGDVLDLFYITGLLKFIYFKQDAWGDSFWKKPGITTLIYFEARLSCYRKTQGCNVLSI
jgi:hypothetical protein